MSDYQDITINKHGGNKQSNAANIRVAPVKKKMKGIIMALMIDADMRGVGVTMIEVATYLKKERNTVAPRFSDLHLKDGLIEPTGFVRDHCTVWRIKGSSRVPLKSTTEGNPG